MIACMPAATPDLPIAFRRGTRTTRCQDGAVTDVHLRRWYPADGDALLAALQADPGLSRQIGALDLSLGRGAAEAYVLRHLVPADGRLQLAVVRDGAVVGNVGVTAIERTHGTGWTHYWLAPVARGRGIARRALATLAGLAFADGLERLELGHRTENHASCRVATAAGFLAEGIERAKLRYGDQRYDVETHARLRGDAAPVLDTLQVL
jgi:RimJ/RimL family protein N-acetyltransferase